MGRERPRTRAPPTGPRPRPPGIGNELRENVRIRLQFLVGVVYDLYMSRLRSTLLAFAAGALLTVSLAARAEATTPDLSGFVPDFTQSIPFLAQGTSATVGGVVVTATTNSAVAGGGGYLHQSNSRIRTVFTFDSPIPGFKATTANHADCDRAACYEAYTFVGKDSSGGEVFRTEIRNVDGTFSYVPGTGVNDLSGLIATLEIDYDFDKPVLDFFTGSYLNLWLTDVFVSPTPQSVTGTTGVPISPTTAFTGAGFTGPITYTTGPTISALTGGTLPDGLVLDPSTGVISGTPTETSTATVTITATGATTGSATATVTFAITAGVGPVVPVEPVIVAVFTG